MTALVSLGTGGAMTAFSLVPGHSAADLTSPASAHIRLLALQQAARPTVTDDGMLRPAIVNVARFWLRLAQGKTPTEMEALIWQHDSIDGVDHGESCAAFASLTLELAAQSVGEQSWVTGGSTYPWPLHKWADVRVDPNPASPGITSIVQDAEAHGRWHPLGDGYRPQPGDWVLFDGHVEVVTKYAGGVLHTIGGDSLPNMSVNAHTYPAPLGAQGVAGFVNNGDLPASPHARSASSAGVPGAQQSAGHRATGQQRASDVAFNGQASIPGAPAARSGQTATTPPDGTAMSAVPVERSSGSRPDQHARTRTGPDHPRQSQRGQPRRHAGRNDGARAYVPATGRSAPVVTAQATSADPADIPGVKIVTAAEHPRSGSGSSSARYARHEPPAGISLPDTPAQEAFIRQVAPGALATQARYHVPAAVTIAQAIDESGWGTSYLATQDHNLFGIKGNGPAGSDLLPTQEYENGQFVSQMASFRVYRNIAQSIEDHAKLLATSGYYGQAMHTQSPNAFAAALTGTYATDPQYGAKLVSLMQQYDLYKFDQPARPAAKPSRPASVPATAQPSRSSPAPAAATPPPPSPTASIGRSHRPAPGGRASHAWSSRGTPPHRPAVGHVRPSRRPVPHGPAPRVTPSRSTVPPAPAAHGQSTPGRSPGRPPASAASGPAVPSNPTIPGVGPVASSSPLTSTSTAPARGTAAGQDQVPAAVHRSGPPQASAKPVPAELLAAHGSAPAPRSMARASRTTQMTAPRYQALLPPAVRNAFLAKARSPLVQAEPVYQDVAAAIGISWELLAACDWMECRADPRRSPVRGEKLGTVNPDGTVYRTKSAALHQCGHDLVALADAVYGVDLTARRHLSVRDLAKAFAAFRWGALLAKHDTSAMEFPYSVAGLTAQRIHMRWPNIDEPNAPDKPGGRFHMPFGAVPVVVGLDYPATADRPA